jgi:iron complex transport system permease protein
MKKNIQELSGIQQYRNLIKQRILLLCILVGILLIMGMVSLCVGSSSLSLQEIIAAFFERSTLSSVIIWKLRLPRMVMAFLVGWALALGGTITQAILRNPLASPFTLGVASGAGFGAVMGIVFSNGLAREVVAGTSFGFAMFTSLLIYGVARLKSATSETLILAGVAIMFLFSSLTSFVQYTATLEEVHEMVFWFFGSLSKAGWPEITIACLMIFPPFPLIISRAWDLNLLMTGDESASSLGVNVSTLRIGGIFLTALMTAGVICFTGVIGFIGLVAPHIARMLIGSDHRFLIPASALLGAILVVGADILSRIIWPPQVIPIGIMTSFLGVPFFFYLLMKKARRNFSCPLILLF